VAGARVAPTFSDDHLEEAYLSAVKEGRTAVLGPGTRPVVFQSTLLPKIVPQE